MSEDREKFARSHHESRLQESAYQVCKRALSYVSPHTRAEIIGWLTNHFGEHPEVLPKPKRGEKAGEE